MIILPEVATKLENILNGLEGFTNPLPYYFQVETEGFHIDHIEKADKSGNFIPVFISSLGGQFNPVKGLKQATYSIPVIIYYPVRFKNDFFALGEFLEDVFVGSKLYYGDISGHAISNISVPQYGEIQNLDFKEFKNWLDSNYQRSFEKMEPFMTMQFTLYLTTVSSGYIYGNDVSADLSVDLDGETYTLSNIVFDDGAIQSQTSPQSEQELGTNESLGLGYGTSYGVSFRIYPDLSVKADGTNVYFYQKIIEKWFSGEIQNLAFDLTFKISQYNNLTFTKKCYISSVNMPIYKGQILSFTITFSRRLEEEEGE